VQSKVSELSRTENSARSFDRKSLRTESPFDYGDSVRKLFVHISYVLTLKARVDDFNVSKQ
jgi:hypothetical protein